MNKPTLPPESLEIANHVIDISDKPTRPTSAEMLVVRSLATLVKEESSFLHSGSLNLSRKVKKHLVDRQPITNDFILDMIELTSYIESAFDKSDIDFGDHNETRQP